MIFYKPTVLVKNLSMQIREIKYAKYLENPLFLLCIVERLVNPFKSIYNEYKSLFGSLVGGTL